MAEFTREQFLARIAFLERHINTWRCSPDYVEKTLKLELYALRLAADAAKPKEHSDAGS